MCNESQTHLEGWTKSADYAFYFILHQVTHKHVLNVVTEWKSRNKITLVPESACIIYMNLIYMSQFYMQKSYVTVISIAIIIIIHVPLHLQQAEALQIQ
jgi:hypothetical protein